MSIERVREYFKSLGQEERVMELTSSSATVELAARALNTAPARIAKTLSFRRPDGGALLIVAAGDTRIENRKYKALFHTKACMLSPQEAADLVGHAPGGVCPFAVNEGVEIYLDISLKRFATVFPACGSSNSAIELTPDELELYTDNRGWVDVCKNWQEPRL